MAAFALTEMKGPGCGRAAPKLHLLIRRSSSRVGCRCRRLRLTPDAALADALALDAACAFEYADYSISSGGVGNNDHPITALKHAPGKKTFCHSIALCCTDTCPDGRGPSRTRKAVHPSTPRHMRSPESANLTWLK